MFTFGFYNSLNGDRKYDAVQMSSIFDGVIEDGVYANVGELFATIPGNGMQVIVKTGRAWFNHTWSLLDSYLPLDIEDGDLLQTRIDAVVLEVDSRIEKRENSIKIVKGIPSVNPVKPTLLYKNGVYQHALAYVTVLSTSTKILSENIEIAVGKNETPFVQCPLKTVSISDLFNQWDGEFTTWFENLKAQLTDNVVTNLQNQIDNRVKTADKATQQDLNNATPNKWVDAKLANGLAPKIGDIAVSDRDLEAESNGQYIALRGQEVNVSTLSEEYFKKIRNRIPLPKVVSNFPAPADQLAYNNGNVKIDSHTNTISQPFACYSKTMSIGEYDYIVSGDKTLYKINHSTGAVVNSVTIPSMSVNGAVFGNNIVLFRANTVYVYNESLSLVRTRSPVLETAGIIRYAASLPNGRIIILTGTSSNVFKIAYTDDMFDTVYEAPMDIAPSNTFISFYYLSRAVIPFGEPGSLLHMTSTGRLFVFPISDSSCLYYSDNYGASWKKYSFSFPSGVSIDPKCFFLIGYGDFVYGLFRSTSHLDDGYPLYFYELNAANLVFTLKKQYNSYEPFTIYQNIYGGKNKQVYIDLTKNSVISNNIYKKNGVSVRENYTGLAIVDFNDFSIKHPSFPIKAIGDGTSNAYLYNNLASLGNICTIGYANRMLFITNVHLSLSTTVHTFVHYSYDPEGLMNDPNSVITSLVIDLDGDINSEIPLISQNKSLETIGLIYGKVVTTSSGTQSADVTSPVRVPVKDGIYVLAYWEPSSSNAATVNYPNLYYDLTKRVMLYEPGKYIKKS